MRWELFCTRTLQWKLSLTFKIKKFKIEIKKGLWITLHKHPMKILTRQTQVERVKKAKDYAFVHFSSRDAAEHALAASKGLVIDEADVSCF